MTQAQAARAGLAEAEKKANMAPEEKVDENLTARQRAMQGLAKTGAVSRREAAGAKGESQHSAAMKNLNIADEPPAKVIPNWKMTGAQKAAHEQKMALRKGGESQMASAMKAFGGQLGSSTAPAKTASTTPRTFVPTAHTPGGSHHWGGKSPAAAPAAARTTPSVASTPPPAPLVSGNGSVRAMGAAEAEEGVEKDLKLLCAGITRLGAADADGTVATTFGKIVDDEELEQQLESLVGTLKAGRRRGVLAWEGQLLLKGRDDNAPIKLVGSKPPAAPEPVAVSEPETEAKENEAPAEAEVEVS